MLPHVNNRGALALICFIALFGFVLQWVAAPPAASITYNKESLLRLHVIANSDSAVDQNLKLAVRDAVLPLLSAIPMKSDALAVEQAIRDISDELTERAQQVVKAAGKDYPVTLEVGDFQFLAKDSPAISLPAGEYHAVRLVIGNGSGRNWWCVLFPPLCFTKEAQAVPVVEAAGTHAISSPKQPTSGKNVKLGMRYLPQLSRSAIPAKVAKAANSWRSTLQRVAGFRSAEASSRK